MQTLNFFGNFRRHFHAALVIALLALAAQAARAADALVYVGTYTGPKSKGIYLYKMDLATGVMTQVGVAAESTNPSFLVLHPNHRFLYAVNEVDKFEGKAAGAVSAFAIDEKTGALTFLNQKTSGGTGPCHVQIDHQGKTVVVANYGGGSIEALPVEKDGKLGDPSKFIQHEGSSVNLQRQKEPHAHCVTIDAANRFALACDLGLDKVLIYKLDNSASMLTPNDPVFGTVPPGSGPRHIALDAKNHFAYIVNELNSTITVSSYDAKRGALKELQSTSTLPADFKGNNSGAEVQIHPNGKFVYTSNRGHNSIAVFAIDAKTGEVTLVENQSTQGKAPRYFGIDPTGKWLVAVNQDTDNMVVYSIDTKTGKLTPTGQNLQVGSPVCVTFLKQ